MKPPSSHRSTHQRHFQCRPGVRSQNVINPELKTLIGVVNRLVFTKAAHCSSGFTPPQEKIKCKDPLYVLEDPRISLHLRKQTLDPSENHPQMMVWKIHLLSTERICLQLWWPATATYRAIFLEFFQLGDRG